MLATAIVLGASTPTVEASEYPVKIEESTQSNNEEQVIKLLSKQSRTKITRKIKNKLKKKKANKKIKPFLKHTSLSATAVKACLKYGKEYDVDPFLVMAVIEIESGGSPRVSNGGCYGLMGISKYWNRHRMKKLGVTDLYDETQNIKVGANLLAELFERHGEGRALVCYNCGEGGAKKVKGLSRYAKHALKRRDTLKGIYKKI